MRNSVIEISNVSKSFKALQAVKDLSLTIYQGEYVALLGPNGAGKTTLIEMIEGIQLPDKGEISIMGRKWKHHEQELHHLIGLSFQETKFIDKLTAEETLDLFGSFYNLGKSRTEEILDLVNLQSKRKSHTSALSGGQRQRLALGVALLNNPRIILLDEPTTGLDPGARRDLWEILERLRKEFGTTMILTTHYMEEAEYLCDRILIMDQGAFLAEGTLEELIQKHGEGEIIEITVNKEISLNENSVTGIRKLNWDSSTLKAKLFVNSITETLPQLIEYVAKTNATILELGCRKMTLDDLFISMTGRHLHESK
jgi:ABC-2 type transport system ATP-binding protein